MNEQVKEILEWYEVEKFNIFDVDSPGLFEALKQAYDNPLPEVTDTPSMPRVKDPKPEDILNSLEIRACAAKLLEIYPDAPLPRKEVVIESCNECVLNQQASCEYDLNVDPEDVGFYRPQIEGFPDNCPLKEGSLLLKTATSKEIKGICRKEVISIQPGDVVVMRCKDKLEQGHLKELASGLEGLFPRNKTVLMANGDSLEVYREQGKSNQRCTLYERECIGDLCSVTPNSVRCSHREQVKDGI